MTKCHIRIDYDPQRPDGNSETLGMPHDDRPARLAAMFRDAGYDVNITRGRHPNKAPNNVDTVVIARSGFYMEVLQLLMESGGFTDFYVKCDRYSTGVTEAQVLIRLGS